MRLPESHYRDKLAVIEDGKREVPVPSGYIDVLTDTELIEVKCHTGWKEAIGQTLAYGHYYPDHQKRIHLVFPNDDAVDISMVQQVCSPLNIRVTYTVEEGLCTYRYFIGLMSFDSPDDIEDYVRELLARGSLTPAEEEFMIALVNLAPWIGKKFFGPVTSVRVVKHHRGTTYFQARSEYTNWLNLSYKNYHKNVHRAKEEVVDYELPEAWDY